MESVFTRNRNVGSNPTLSAILSLPISRQLFFEKPSMIPSLAEENRPAMLNYPVPKEASYYECLKRALTPNTPEKKLRRYS